MDTPVAPAAPAAALPAEELDGELVITLEDGVLTLRIDREEHLGALTELIADEVAHELEEARSDDRVRVVCLTGTGAAFSAGADLTRPGALDALDVTSLDRANRIIRAITSLDKPVVAGVNGVAAGVGMASALACDLAVCTASATFVLGFPAVGLMPDGGSSATLVAAVGRARAMRAALLSEPITAEEAYAAGLVSHCVPDEEYAPTLDRVLRRLATGAPLALAATKKAVNAVALAHLEGALERERSGQSVLLRTADAAEGVAAFAEKRRPSFRGE